MTDRDDSVGARRKGQAGGFERDLLRRIVTELRGGDRQGRASDLTALGRSSMNRTSGFDPSATAAASDGSGEMIPLKNGWPGCCRMKKQGRWTCPVASLQLAPEAGPGAPKTSRRCYWSPPSPLFPPPEPRRRNNRANTAALLQPKGPGCCRACVVRVRGLDADSAEHLAGVLAGEAGGGERVGACGSGAAAERTAVG